MLDTIPATKAKNNFGALIKHVYTSGEPVIVAKDGIPVVVISRITERDFRSKGRDRALLTLPAESSNSVPTGGEVSKGHARR